ncbi:MAG: Gamma-glutamyltranspeptidase @ Glutathione hydrolase [uncultured Rubrobacteraceae bacterium]|uniref:Gamma-glutamyltranspeptidase @ Glutathione hydrolase n=1 Tax=uncultured Rubrobacteraceae bacterium TaxID=349277 RepID=A0A6J4NNV7_9ACTN|nr:MAG: Gamma-glutamyltranspeptidase @ Glutathione hydrolase [uncultured Rubrobacteraceae bacterium]
MKRLFLVFSVLVVCSCGAQPAPPQGDSGERDDREPTVERAVAERSTTGDAEESTAQEDAPTQKSGGQGAESTRPADGEPELREGPATTSTASRAAVGTNGMVSTAHPLATRAGVEVLQDGGNAFDAAVAVGAALNVVEPMMSGVGGYGATVVYDAERGETRFLETGSRTPESLDPSIFRPPTPGYQENRCGGPVVSTPGNLNAWRLMWEEYGEEEWSRLFEPAVGYAEEGFVIGEETAGWIGSEYPAFPANAQEIYGRNGAPLRTGDRLVQEDLADSMRTIAENGAGAIYGGELGQAMVAEARENGSFLTEKDLRENRARWRPTVVSDYGGGEIVTAGPPSTAWGALLRLGTMGELDPASLGQNTSPYVHALTEISKNAFSQTSQYAADPPLDELLTEPYFAEQAAAVDFSAAGPIEWPRTSDPAKSCSPTGYVPTTDASASASASASAQASVGHTTHFVVADREGNVVSSTQTLGNVFGSKLMPEGTGLWLNDQLAWSRFEPRGTVFDVYAGRQTLYALCPTIVLRDGRPVVALGTPGGRTIPQTTTQMITNIQAFGMDVQEAISAPRFSFVIPDLLGVEPQIPADVRSQLEVLGHNVYVDEFGFGNAHGLAIEYGKEGNPSRFTGGADPRGEGAATGL